MSRKYALAGSDQAEADLDAGTADMSLTSTGSVDVSRRLTAMSGLRYTADAVAWGRGYQLRLIDEERARGRAGYLRSRGASDDVIRAELSSSVRVRRTPAEIDRIIANAGRLA